MHGPPPLPRCLIYADYAPSEREAELVERAFAGCRTPGGIADLHPHGVRVIAAG
jgi:hypothetical protein